MRIQDPGFINANIQFCGSPNICMYLVKGRHYALLGGGVAWEVPRLEAQLDQYQVDRRRIRYLVISHTHHDHCSAVPYLLRKYPHIQTVASEYGAYILNKSQPVQMIKQVTRQILDAQHHPHQHNGIPLDFQPIPVALRMTDGDHLDLGDGLALRFYLTPGHTRCSLSVYIPELQALFPADAVPFPDIRNGKFTVTADHRYDDYIRSLEKLKALSVRLVGYEHGGVLAGQDAAGIIARSLAATRRQRQRIRQRFEELQDFDRLVEETAGKYQALPLFRQVPPDVIRAITARMIRSALEET
ncbi:MAG: MBL fold metallo-hydrolase [Desulfobacterales bacterium]|nr:MAG: MBL fold metallo-hydrolase [Desulfobacterales bacterium]